MENMKIRMAHIGDRERVVSTIISAYRKYVEIMGAAPAAMTQDYGSKIDAETIHVVEVDEEIIAAVELVPKSDFLYLGTLSVVPEMQGEGYGRKLLSYAEWYALSKNLKEIRLFTNEILQDLMLFYKRSGYETWRKEIVDGHARVLFFKKL